VKIITNIVRHYIGSRPYSSSPQIVRVPATALSAPALPRSLRLRQRSLHTCQHLLPLAVASIPRAPPPSLCTRASIQLMTAPGPKVKCLEDSEPYVLGYLLLIWAFLLSIVLTFMLSRFFGILGCNFLKYCFTHHVSKFNLWNSWSIKICNC
jgi:hypothetical protein